MKIGILTFHRALNYGAVLQCFGLYSVLQSLGYEPEIIDYRPESIERYRKFYSSATMKLYKGFFPKLKEFVASIIISCGRKKASHRFDSFLNKYFKLSCAFNEPKSMLSGYNAIIFGSDQIWSPSICFGFDKMYWGQFEHGKAKLITYAASIGGHNKLSSSDWLQINKYIEAYDSISVREIQLKNMLSNNCHKEIPVVVDPTILAGEKVFDEIAQKPIDTNYVLLFTLEQNDNSYSFAKNIADKEKLKVVTLKALPSYKKDKNMGKEVAAVSIEEFLGYFKYAKYIVAISFHGTVFSVLFRRDFYSLKCAQGDRAYNFLKSIGLENRMVDANNLIYPTKVDYSDVSNKIERLRSTSMQYLKDSLKL
ncbi:polysaccharide pyruvyl transferase family protein [Segatella copri]|uniref:polysaccharide pyruvyl transferase family protein n=1 Tax=Segatella copri TaxID=165179 RepID=UPI002FF105E9